MSGTTHKQPWLQSAGFDLPFFLLPGILALIVTVFLPQEYKTSGKMSVAGWVILILLVDVAHVYSTLFRTYWDKKRFAKHRTLYLVIPVACYLAGVLLYTVGELVFWRILAYLAVYHFIRQQYGFMRLYARYELKDTIGSMVDTITVYAATIYPLVYWHLTPGRNFNWFVDGDFFSGNSVWLKQVALFIYVAIVAVYCVKEIRAFLSEKKFNVPKNFIILSTLATWYFGIVYFNGDMAFTLLNVVAHGVPYMALIWLYQQKENGLSITRFFSGKLIRYSILFFIGSLVLFAYLEEGLWDGLVWREHSSVFGLFQYLPVIHTKEFLAFLVPLLSLPQSTHYVLDGFIWRKGHG